MLICRTCGKQFENKRKTGRNPVSCSVECRLIYKRAKNAERHNAALLAEQATWKLTRVCVGCGATYVPIMRKQTYCSLACRKMHQGKHGATVTRTCKACGKTFEIESKRHNTANCEECRKQRRKGYLAKVVSCQQCGKHFNPRHDNRGYCSRSCAGIANAAKYRHKHPPKPPKKAPSRKTERTCRVCHKNFIGTKTQWLCSAACYRTDRHMRCWARRAHYKETAMEPIDFDKVCERDRWTCGICGKPVDPALKWPNPDARSLDHIVPISQGGPHLYDNVQLTHLGCNWRKAKPHAQDGEAFHTPGHPHYPAPSQRTARAPRRAGKPGGAQLE